MKTSVNPPPSNGYHIGGLGTTNDYCRYIKAPLNPYSGDVTVGGGD